jgi:membrane protease subunit HflK
MRIPLFWKLCFPGLDMVINNNIGRKILIGIAALLLIYFATGIYTLQNGQYAIVLQFGKVIKEVRASGINYHLPYPIEHIYPVHVSKVQKVSIQKQKSSRFEEITGDENLIMVDAVISYDVRDLTSYLFNQADVKSVVASAGQMCLSQQLAQMMVDDVMTTGKSVLQLVMKNKLQEALDNVGTGVRIISVELTNISPPSSVSMTFKAVSDAREKKQEIIKAAEGYTNSTIPNARGEASKLISDAEAYSEEIQNLARAKAQVFEALLVEYQHNPEVTSNLKYLETLKTITKQCKVHVDANSKESIYYIGQGGKFSKK